MSYCRFSSMDWKCDVYCYEDVVTGFTIHLAGQRYPTDIPTTTANILTDPDAFMEQHTAQMVALKDCVMEPIGLPGAGETICVDSLDELKTTLLELRTTGYRFPDHVLHAIDEEMAEDQGA